MKPSDNIPLAMVRDDLADIPSANLASGFQLRAFQPGDESHWVRIHELADRFNACNLTTFKKQFGRSTVELSSRQFYLTAANGLPIGTASAWFGDETWGRDWGRVHWVAIVPEFQGRGLAKSLMALVLRRLAELGHGRAYLITSSARTPAIRLYEAFGFRGHARTDHENDVWRELRETRASR